MSMQATIISERLPDYAPPRFHLLAKSSGSTRNIDCNLVARGGKASRMLTFGLVFLFACFAARVLIAQTDDLRAKTQNPVGNLISVPMENTVDFGAPNGSAYFLNIQPVIPVTVGDWNLINRIIMPLIYVPGPITGTPQILGGTKGGSAFGLGDINYSVFLSPAKPGAVIWGLGPSINFRTATDDLLGSGKWSAGPTAVLLTQPKPWSLGVLVRNIFSFAGDSKRATVNQFLLQPFINYNLEDGWYLTSDPILTANWNAKSGNRWTVPLGAGIGKLFTIGTQPINTKLQFYGNVQRPKNAPEWSMRFTIAFLFPK